MSASDGTLLLTANDQDLFNAADDGGPCLQFMVRNQIASLANALVRVPGLQQPGRYVPIPPGEVLIFTYRCSDLRTVGILSQVIAKQAGAGVTVEFGVLAR